MGRLSPLKRAVGPGGGPGTECYNIRGEHCEAICLGHRAYVAEVKQECKPKKFQSCGDCAIQTMCIDTERPYLPSLGVLVLYDHPPDFMPSRAHDPDSTRLEPSLQNHSPNYGGGGDNGALQHAQVPAAGDPVNNYPGNAQRRHDLPFAAFPAQSTPFTITSREPAVYETELGPVLV
jgi:hypothetical protein